MESGLRAEEIAARLGVSRAALYRYEKGEVIKLDTVKRLAELLKISPLSLLGIGVEYYTRPSASSSGCGRWRKRLTRSCKSRARSAS